MEDQVSAEMPKYRCHKIVHALKIERVMIHDPSGTGKEADGIPVDNDSVKFSGGHLFPEDKMFAPIAFDADFYRKHRPQDGGYYVVYEDGYKSYSPAKAFDEGIRESNN